MSHDDRRPRTVTRQPPYQAEPLYWMKLSNANDSAERLNPGGSALAILRRWNVGTEEWVDITENPETHYGRVRVYDPGFLNFILPNEIFLARLVVGAGRFEVVGSHGLRRKVKIQAATIAAGGSGTVRVWVNGAVTSPTQDLTAYYTWMDAGGSDLTSGMEALVEYFRDEQKWVITNAEC